MGLWMAGSQSHTASVAGASPRYRVRLLGDPRVTDRGVLHGGDEGRQLLAWAAVERVIAAEVGEPQGVRTIVFDLVVEREGSDCTVCRLDADPGGEAVALAQAVAAGLGSERIGPSIKSLVTDGSPSRWYPDLESFEVAALEEILGS